MKTNTQNTCPARALLVAILAHEGHPLTVPHKGRCASFALPVDLVANARELLDKPDPFPAMAEAIEAASLYLTGSGRACAQVTDEDRPTPGHSYNSEVEGVIAEVEAARALLGSEQPTAQRTKQDRAHTALFEAVDTLKGMLSTVRNDSGYPRAWIECAERVVAEAETARALLNPER